MAKKRQGQAKPQENAAANKSSTAGKRSEQGATAARSAPPKAPTATEPITKKRKHSRNTSGFAETKEYPHKKHPAKFKKKRGSDKVEYITFTHSAEVEIDNIVVTTKPLNSNINPKERGTLNEKGEPNISYAYPKVYVGKRSALGKGTEKYSLVEADRKIVDELFATLPREEVPETSNSKKKGKK